MMKLAALVLFAAVSYAQTWSVGAKVPAFTYYELSGKSLSSADTGSEKATAVIFVSAKCPISNAYADRMSALYREYSAKGVRFLFLNANSNEDAAEVAQHIKEVSFPFAVYKDINNRVADSAGADLTPESYVIDAAGVLRYHGAIDDSTNEARVKRRGLRDALDAVLAGKPVATAEIKAFGCTIKRVRKGS